MLSRIGHRISEKPAHSNSRTPSQSIAMAAVDVLARFAVAGFVGMVDVWRAAGRFLLSARRASLARSRM